MFEHAFIFEYTLGVRAGARWGIQYIIGMLMGNLHQQMLTKCFTDRFKTYKISLSCSDYIFGNQLIFLKTVLLL